MNALHTELLTEFGVAAVFTSREGDEKPTRAVLDEVTNLVGALGGQVDPRPSLRLLVADVGRRPKGEVAIGQRLFELDRAVDGDNDAYLIRVYAREKPQ